MELRDDILLVEDNEDDIFFMKRALKTAGIQNPLQIIEDGESALNFFNGVAEGKSESVPRLVLLDLKLPYVPGLEVLRRIREISALDAVILVVLTTSRENSDLQKAYSLGANSYLVKPPQSDDLVDLARRLKLYWLEVNQQP
jgi:CheY-like chemotaxis protein